MKYALNNPLHWAYLTLKDAGELVIPSGRMKAGFWVGSDLLVTRGGGTVGRYTLFVDYWEGKPKARAMKIVRKLKKAGLQAYIGSPYAL